MKNLPYRILGIALLALTAVSGFSQITVQNLNLGAENINSYSISDTEWRAQSFTTDAYASSYQLASVTILSDGTSGTPSGFTLRLFSDNSNAPGSSLETLSGSSDPSGSNVEYSYSSSGTTLNANTTYWVVASSAVGTYWWGATSTTDETTTGGATWSIGDGYGRSTDSGTSWSSMYTGFTLQMSVTTAAVPEPSTYAAILGACALGFVGFRRYRSKRVA